MTDPRNRTTSYSCWTNREERYAEERRVVTEEATQKTAELAVERVETRDFALEAVRQEMAERKRRADEYAAVLQSVEETEEEKEIREHRERSLEADLEEEQHEREAAEKKTGGGEGETLWISTEETWFGQQCLFSLVENVL